jgi:hypothetical protein
MTAERGCTTSEAEVAARKIGEAVQRYDLVVCLPAGTPSARERSFAIPGVEAITETDKALLVIIDDEQVWVPLSQISDESEVMGKGDYGTLVVTSWFAQRKGWCGGRRTWNR